MNPSPSPARPTSEDPGLRAAATAVAQRLVEGGFMAYFAGGCVRDRLLGTEPKDYDIATDAHPDQVAKLFRRVQHVGESFGVMLVHQLKHQIEVATFRTDGVYSDGRHPDEVTFSDAEHDARRRDFTINGLFEEPDTGRIIDYVGGQDDLQRKVVRAIGDPRARIREDRLRMLRAVRFAARFGFSIDDDTAEAVRAGASELEGVSRERIGAEVRHMLSDPNRGVAAWEMQYLVLDEAVLEEGNKLIAPTRVGRLPDNASFPTALAAWLLDRHGDDEVDEDVIVETASRWAQALMISNAERSQFLQCLGIHAALRDAWTTMGIARQKRLASLPHFADALSIVQTVDRAGFVEIRRRVTELKKAGGLAPEALVDGDDLISLGLTPGPLFKRVLDAVYDAQLEGALPDKEAALALARALAPAEDSADGED